MQVSIIIPLYNEAESLPELCSWIQRVLDKESLSYEIWCIDDGSTDASWDTIVKLKALNPQIKALRFRTNQGKSAALNCGFERAQGNVVITMDADLQDSPDEIPGLYSMIMNDGFFKMIIILKMITSEIIKNLLRLYNFLINEFYPIS